MNISPREREICLQFLQQISEEPALIDNDERMKSLIAKIHKEGKRGQRRHARQERTHHDRQLKAQTATAQKDCTTSLPVLPQTASHSTDADNFDEANATFFDEKLHRATRCYICKEPYRDVHFFYHLLCPGCAAFNYQKRMQRADLSGRVALITGARIKIGHEMALQMLRDGAEVIVTTRFARDAAERFSRAPDFPEWRDRLSIYPLDLRDIPAVEAFAAHLSSTRTSLDILINNAAQTIKRPPAFYRHLQESDERKVLMAGAPETMIVHRVPSNENEDDLYFPAGFFDAHGQQMDLRPLNSWRLRLGEVETWEMLEVQLVNAVAPFLLNSRLKPLLLRSNFERRFIINVSAMEGQFNRVGKTAFHPHTNMAKAALNMMTRTSAADYARDGIYMNSVDTGWVTDENPHAQKIYQQQSAAFYTPLDIIDGMARLYDPIVQGIMQPAEPLHGHFLKDYAPHDW